MTDKERAEYYKERIDELNWYYYTTLFVETFISLIFFVSILVFEFKIGNIANKIDKERRSVNQFSLLVESLPVKDLTEEEMVIFFGNFGKVVTVHFGYKFDGTLRMVKEIVHINRSLKRMLENKKITKDKIKKRA